MTAFTLHAEVTDRATPMLEAMKDRVEHLDPVLLGPIADSLRAAFQAQFWSQGSYFGTPWEPLAPSTRQKKRGAAWGPFVPDSDVFRSLTERNAAHSILHVQDNSLTFGTDAPGAVEAQFGTVHEPPRELVPSEWPAADVNHWAEMIGQYIIEGRL